MMNKDEFRKGAHAVIEDVINYFTSLPGRRVTASIAPGYLRPQLPKTAPEEPEPFEKIVEDVDSKIVPGLTHWQSPRFMAWFPAHTTFPSILAEIYSATFNAPAFNWICSPACTELETVVLDWVCQALGLPDCYLSESSNGGGGVIQGTASEAVAVCMIAARERAVRSALEKEGLAERPDETVEQARKREDRAADVRSKLVALGSEQAHSCTEKAAIICGVRYRSVAARKEDGLRMLSSTIRSKIDELRKDGLQPFYLTTALGSTGTGAIDDFEGIAREIKGNDAYKDIWVHVDAAYAGAALICPEIRELAGVKYFENFDSFDFNMHKWMLVNFDASCLYVRNRLDLISALSISPSYLTNNYYASGLVTDYRDWQIPLGRRFRALKIWFVLRTYGVKKIQELIRGHIKLGETFASLVSSSSASGSGNSAKGTLELLYGPAFGLSVIRCVAPPLSSSFSDDNTAIPSYLPSSSKKVEKAAAAEGEAAGGGVEGAAGGAEGGSGDGSGSGGRKEEAERRNNALTQKVYELINARGEFFLTSASLHGVYAIRVVSANELAHEKYVRRLYTLLHETMQEVLLLQRKEEDEE